VLGIRSGTTVVTAKAKENNVFSSIEIQVYTPVADLQLNKEKLVLQIGDSYTVTPIILPDDAPDTQSNLILFSSNAFNAPICAAAFIPPPDKHKPIIVFPPMIGYASFVF